MKWPSSITAGLLAAFLASCSSGPMVLSQWQSKPVVVDGYASEWDRPLAYYDKDSKLNYSITNDSAKLYLCVQVYDIETQMKLLRAGLQLWLDTSGGSAKEIGVLYPVAGTMIRSGWSESPQLEGGLSDYDPVGRMRRNFLRSQGEIELQGFKSPIGGMVPLKNAFGIEVRINWDTINNVLNYEAGIPFSAFYHPRVQPQDSLLTLGIQFVVNGVERSQRNGSREAGEGREGIGGGGVPGGGVGIPGSGGGYGGGLRPGGGGGGMGRGGGKRGGGGQSGASGRDLSHSETFKIRVRLAAPASR